MNDNQRDAPPPKGGSRPGFPRQAGLIFLGLLSLLALVQFAGGRPDPTELTYNRFVDLLADTTMRIYRIELIPGPDGTEIRGLRSLTSEERRQAEERHSFLRPDTARKFHTRVIAVEDSTLRRWVADRGATVIVEERGGQWLSYMLIYLLPLLLFIGLWMFMMRQGQQGPRGLFNFGKSRARTSDRDIPKVTFDDVAGCDESKAELVEVIEFLRDPGRFDRLGGRIPRGVLLMGPPGTGKTLLAKAVAGEARVPFFSMSGSSFVEMFVGVGASRVRDLFEQAKKTAPCIIFIDEIDAVGRQRGTGLGGGHDEREQTLNQLLIEMDGFEGNDGVIIIAATNRPDVLDPALLRPGRFDRRVIVDRPDVRGRRQILEVHTATRIPLAPDVDLDVLARGTPGFSGADLANLCNEAALLAAREGKDRVSMADFGRAKDKVSLGSERRSMVMSEDDKKVTAYHEAGHAVVAWHTPGADPVHKVTIIPRGRALGVTMQLPERDRYNVTRHYLEGSIAISMGGRLAEEIFLDQISTGAASDIQRATELARRMVVEWGMSPLGPINYESGHGGGNVFLGRDLSIRHETSEETTRQVDAAVRSLVEQNVDRARALLETHRDQVHALAQALLERENLEDHDLQNLLGPVLGVAKT